MLRHVAWPEPGKQACTGAVVEEAAGQVASGVLHSWPYWPQLVDSATSADLTASFGRDPLSVGGDTL